MRRGEKRREEERRGEKRREEERAGEKRRGEKISEEERRGEKRSKPSKPPHLPLAGHIGILYYIERFIEYYHF